MDGKQLYSKHESLFNNFLEGKPSSSIDKDPLNELISHWIHTLKSQRQLIDIPDSKILLLGDIHGDLQQLTRAFDLFDRDNFDYMILNGDLVDRGSDMIECLQLVMARQILDPEHVIFLRGNHEIQAINEIYGFRGYCTGLYGSNIYHLYSKAFQQLPLAAKLGDWGFACHGGIPKQPIYFHLMRLEPKEPEPDNSIYSQLLWNDPDESIDGFEPSIRGDGIYRFGTTSFQEFMEFHELEVLFRAHQAFPEGYRWFFDDQLLSVFSSNAGPYRKIQPHFVQINQKSIELISAMDL